MIGRPGAAISSSGLFFVFLREVTAYWDRDQRCADEKRHPKPGCFGFDGAVNKKKRSDDRIEQPPDDINQSGRQSLAGRLGERCREFIAAYPLNKMRDGIGEKNTGKECAEVELPDHVYSFA